MKEQHSRCRNPRRRSFRAILLSVTLLGMISAALADDLIVNTFDTGISGIDWQNFRSYAYGSSEVWDGLQDASGNPNSGSLYLSVNWPLASDPNWNSSWNDVQIAFGTPQINSTDYITFECD